MKLTVTRYDDLREWADAFARGCFEVFILVGDPGLGKTRIVTDRTQGQVRIIEGRVTAFELYRELYRHCNEPFLIDDVDQLYSDKDAIRLLKCLCQTEPVKSLAWHSATSKLDKEEIPREFETRSKVAIIANVWKDLNANIGAVEDRGILIQFKPTAAEVHQWVGSWYRKKKISPEVYRFIGEHLDLISEPSGRHYYTAERIKGAGLNWQDALYETWGLTAEMAVVIELLADETLTQEQRVEAFEKRTGKSRATFFRYQSKLKGGRRKLVRQ